MDSSIITGLLVIGSNAVTFFLGQYFGRKKDAAKTEKITAETDQIRLHNASDIIEIYKKAYDDLALELKLVSHKCSELSNEINSLRSENVSLKQEIHALTANLKQQ